MSDEIPKVRTIPRREYDLLDPHDKKFIDQGIREGRWQIIEPVNTPVEPEKEKAEAS